MGGRGGSYSRSGFLGPHGKQKTVEEALAGANPHYREGREWQQNCQRCIYAYEMQRRGYDVEALPRIFDGTDRLPYMYDKNGWLAVMDGAKAVDFPSRNTIQKMADQMANWGDGARAIVRVQWKWRNATGTSCLCRRTSARATAMAAKTPEITSGGRASSTAERAERLTCRFLWNPRGTAPARACAAGTAATASAPATCGTIHTRSSTLRRTRELLTLVRSSAGRNRASGAQKQSWSAFVQPLRQRRTRA